MKKLVILTVIGICSFFVGSLVADTINHPVCQQGQQQYCYFLGGDGGGWQCFCAAK